jgi:hypothetical protein
MYFTAWGCLAALRIRRGAGIGFKGAFAVSLTFGLLSGIPTANAAAALSHIAGHLPTYGIAGYCRKISNTVGGPCMIEKGCRDQENQAITVIRAADVLPRIYSYFNRVAPTAGVSYMIFNGCTDQILGATGKMH